MKTILSILICLVCNHYLAQNPGFYYTRFGTEGDDVGNKIINSKNGDYLIAGQTTGLGSFQNDFYLARIDSLSQLKWQKNYGGEQGDVANSLVELNDSSIVMVGYSNSFGNGGYDTYVIRVDKDGNKIWDKTFGGMDWDFGTNILRTSDGALIICGYTYSYGNGDMNAFLLKIDYNGNQIWNKIFGGKKEDRLNELIQASDGSVFGVGMTKSYGDSLGDLWLTKFNLNGDSLRFITYGGSKFDSGNSIVQDSNNEFFLTGASESYSNGKKDIYIVKLSTTYNIVWERNYGLSTQDEEGYSIKTSTSSFGNLMVCYSTYEVGAFKTDAKALLLDGLGYYKDGGRIGLYEDDEVYSIANCSDKGYILSGYTKSFDARMKDVFVIRFDSLVHGTGTLIINSQKENISIQNRFGIVSSIFTNQLIISNSNNDWFNFELYSLDGVIISKVSGLKNEQVTIPIPNLTSGIYLIKLKSENEEFYYKVICTN